MKEKQRSDPYYDIVAVVQTSPDAEGLKTSFLTELLGLSVDRPKNLFSFNSREAREKLLKVSFIKEATIAKIRPGTIHVDYMLRKPIAYFADYANTAIDADNILFPLKPFFTPKKLPEIYIGVTEFLEAPWGTKIVGEEMKLALALLNLAPKYCDDCSAVSRIDVSRSFAPSDGEREVIVILEDRVVRVVEERSILFVHPRILRLNPDNYEEQLINYTVLRSYLRGKDHIEPIGGTASVQHGKAMKIDLRLSDLAFFSKDL